MKLIHENCDRVIFRLKDGTIIIADDYGFSAKCLPERDGEIKTTEWGDWLLLNDTLNKITRGKPIVRSGSYPG